MFYQKKFWWQIFESKFVVQKYWAQINFWSKLGTKKIAEKKALT